MKLTLSLTPCLLVLFTSFIYANTEPQTSELWGEAGELWQPPIHPYDHPEREDYAVELRDFTTVGYMEGTQPLPRYVRKAEIEAIIGRPWDWHALTPIPAAADDSQEPTFLIDRIPDIDAAVREQLIANFGVNFFVEWKSITEFGAVADDNVSDLQAIQTAIANCPPHHVVGIPNGVFIIDNFLPIEIEAAPVNNILIRGESRDRAILYLPKHLNEIYPDINYDEFEDSFYMTPFIRFGGGYNRGLENVSVLFRDEQKATGYVVPNRSKQRGAHWYKVGENPIVFTGGEKHSWLRDVYIKNANHAIRIEGNKTEHITLLDIVLDQFVERKSPRINRSGHMGIKLGGNTKKHLIHNIRLTDKWSHDICPMGTKYTVFSRITGSNMEIDHHAMGNAYNLFTEIDGGDKVYGVDGNITGLKYTTFWGISGREPSGLVAPGRQSIVVGINTEEPADIGVDYHNEPLDPTNMVPGNLYLAQLAFKNAFKEGATALGNQDWQVPAEWLEPANKRWIVPDKKALKRPVDGKPIRLLADEDVFARAQYPDTNYGSEKKLHWQNGDYDSFLKFDLSDFFPNALGLDRPASVKLKILASDLPRNEPISLKVQGVNNDSWSEHTLTWNNKPTAGSVVATELIETEHQWYELDVTTYVHQQLDVDSNKLISFRLSEGATAAEGEARTPSVEDFKSAQLVIYWDASMVPPPSRPTGLVATEGTNQVSLDWDDNPEPDLAGYNLYRRFVGMGEELPFEPIAMNFSFSEYTDYWTEFGVTYEYLLKAVDTAGKESTEGITARVTPADENAPNPPRSLHALVDDGHVLLQWAENDPHNERYYQPDLATYEVYRAATRNGYGDAIVTGLTTPFYVDDEVANGATYYYVVVAVDTSNNVSLPSNDIAVIPFGHPVKTIAEYTFDGGSFASTDVDFATQASDLSDGGGLHANTRKRGPRSTRPVYAWSVENINEDTLQDDNYVSFTITPHANRAVTFYGLTYHAHVENAAGADVYLYSSQDGFTQPIDAIRLTGEETIYPSMDLTSMAQASSPTEFRLYFAMSATSNFGNVWVDNIRLSEINELVDMDNDGIADSWEYTYYGDLTTTDGQGDFDHDRQLDMDEYITGNDPTDDSSMFGIIDFTVDSQAEKGLLTFNSHRKDLNRSYRIFYTDDLTAPHWQETQVESIRLNASATHTTAQFSLPADMASAYFKVECYLE